ncbi:UNKNOWN [Stylonychia lemnae]|uniref:Uncharacterized protein n=1 Tax=Stylonychia lemnae TaxID=5949 RepID=A0A078ATX9_STYLE|nr:UNKNOWN [Stylonychia lemnae]|eukprot:CDW85714.1 UNKNOWN [Stylonychia lemnae]
MRNIPADNRFVSQTLNLKIDNNDISIYRPLNSMINDSKLVSTTSQSLQQKAFARRQNVESSSVFKNYEAYGGSVKKYSRLMTAPTEKTMGGIRRSLSNSKKQRQFSQGGTSMNSQNYLKVQNLINNSKGLGQINQDTIQNNGDILSNGFQVISFNSLEQIDSESKKRPYSSAVNNRTNNNNSISNSRALFTHSNMKKQTVQPSSNGNPMLSHQGTTIFSQKSLSKKSETLKIEVIDTYYQSINNLDEVERIRFINDFTRLMNQIEKIFNTNERITLDEVKYVKGFLKKEVYEQGNYSPYLLQKMNQYIQFLQRFTNTENKLRNLIDERESIIYKLGLLNTVSSIIEFEKSQGIQMIMQLRHYTMRIIKLFKMYLSYIKDSNCNIIRYRANVPCYLCKILQVDSKELRQINVIFLRLSVFLEDFIMFVPKNAKKILDEMNSHKIKTMGFTVTEVSSFENINQKLVSDNLDDINACMEYLKHHICSANSKGLNKQNQISEDIDMFMIDHFKKEQVNPNQTREFNASLKHQKIKRFFNFQWIDSNFQMASKNEYEMRNDFKDRIQNAYSQFQTILNEEQHIIKGESETDNNRSSVNDLYNDASYREGINLFQIQTTGQRSTQNHNPPQINQFVNQTTIQESFDNFNSGRGSIHQTESFQLNPKRSIESIQDPIMMTEANILLNSFGIFKSQKYQNESAIEINTVNNVLVEPERCEVVYEDLKEDTIQQTERITSKVDQQSREMALHHLLNNKSSNVCITSENSTQPRIYNSIDLRIVHQKHKPQLRMQHTAKNNKTKKGLQEPQQMHNLKNTYKPLINNKQPQIVRLKSQEIGKRRVSKFNYSIDVPRDIANINATQANLINSVIEDTEQTNNQHIIMSGAADLTNSFDSQDIQDEINLHIEAAQDVDNDPSLMNPTQIEEISERIMIEENLQL